MPPHQTHVTVSGSELSGPVTETVQMSHCFNVTSARMLCAIMLHCKQSAVTVFEKVVKSAMTAIVWQGMAARPPALSSMAGSVKQELVEITVLV